MNKDYVCQRNKTVIVKQRGETHQLEMEKITHITCDGYLSSIHLIDKEESIKVSKLLKLFEEELIEYDFIRVNNNTLVNIKNIASVKNKEKQIIINSTNQQIKISRRKLHLFKSFLNK